MGIGDQQSIKATFGNEIARIQADWLIEVPIMIFPASNLGFGVTFDLSVGGYMDASKTSIAAVHDDNLTEFLDSLGVLSEVTKGRAKCKFCHGPVTLDNLAAVFPESGDVKFVCDKVGCLPSLTEHRAELRGTEKKSLSESPN